MQKNNIVKTVFLGEKTDADGDDVIEMYQPMKNILSALLDMCRDSFGSVHESGSGAAVIGIYTLEATPDERLAFAASLAGTEPFRTSLYMTFERFSGLRERFGTFPRVSLSDLIFLYKTDRSKLAGAAGDSLIKSGSLNILAADDTLEDLDEMSISEWKDFIGLVAHAAGSDTVVLDMAEGFRNLREAFSICSCIYTDKCKNTFRKAELRNALLRLFPADEIRNRLKEADFRGQVRHEAEQ